MEKKNILGRKVNKRRERRTNQKLRELYQEPKRIPKQVMESGFAEEFKKKPRTGGGSGSGGSGRYGNRKMENSYLNRKEWKKVIDQPITLLGF